VYTASGTKIEASESTGTLPRQVLHVDMDAFFAAVELLHRS
jgi:hypothetical protein